MFNHSIPGHAQDSKNQIWLRGWLFGTKTKKKENPGKIQGNYQGKAWLSNAFPWELYLNSNLMRFGGQSLQSWQ